MGNRFYHHIPTGAFFSDLSNFVVEESYYEINGKRHA